MKPLTGWRLWWNNWQVRGIPRCGGWYVGCTAIIWPWQALGIIDATYVHQRCADRWCARRERSDRGDA